MFRFIIILISISCNIKLSIHAQTIEKVVFSNVASSNNNFQPIIGTPFGTYLNNSNGSLTVSAEYGENTIEESGLIVSNSKSYATKISVYPNPSSATVNIDFRNLKENYYKLLLVNINGEKITEKPVSKDIETIDMSNYSNGLYILKVYMSNNETEIFKINKIN